MASLWEKSAAFDLKFELVEVIGTTARPPDTPFVQSFKVRTKKHSS